QFLFDENGNGANRSAESKRAHVAHKDLGRMCVVPEKADTRSDHCAAEDRQLRYLGHLLQSQIFCKPGVPADVCKYCQCSSSDDGATDGETVESVGEINCISRAHNHQRNKRNERQKSDDPEMRHVEQLPNRQVWLESLGERNHEMRG